MIQLLNNINGPSDIRKLSPEELDTLASEIRDVVIKQVADKGGHLASNLGAVELTIALHLVFNAPEDKIIWDVGHQSYPHKIITGRYKQFHTLKQYGGLSGFLTRAESEFDAFGGGHASTSLAAAMGFAVARTRQEKNHHIVAVIGDGSMTGGMAYEALNNVGASSENITFVLNDNKMSIAPNVGAVNKYLNRILTNPTYNRLKEEIWDLTGRLPKKEGIRKIVSKIDDTLKHLVLPGGFFQDLGLRYFGPINGHDIEELKEIFKQIKNISRPCLVHVVTEKGHGWDKAEKDAYKWHASAPFYIDSGQEKAHSNSPALATVFGEALTEIAQKDEKVIGITAAMPDGTGLNIMERQIPDRVFDVGIAEQYAVTFAAGLACEGMKPIVAVYSSFLQRAVDQIIHDVAIQNLNVAFVISHSGLVGVDGPTHHGAMTLSYLRMIPNMVIMAASDEVELRNMLYTAYMTHKGPVALCYSKGNALNQDRKPTFQTLETGMPQIITRGDGILILSVGHMLSYAKQAAELLEKDGLSPTLVNARFVKPLDENAYRKLLSGHSAVLTVEDNVINGGFGSGISEMMTRMNMYQTPVKHIGLPDTFVTHGEVETLYATLGMDEQGIYKQALELYKAVRIKSL
jgi:1-deoxy-D-xylulose-5-phosphate synthase